MIYANSPQVTGASVRALTFSADDTPARGEPESGPPDSTPAVDVPTPRTTRSQRRHVVPPRLADYPDVLVTTPSRASRAWLLPTGEKAGFNTLTDASADYELAAELARVDLTCSLSFHGALIGMITTRRPTHICEFPNGYATTALRCAGCRWFETRVFRLDDYDSSRLGGSRYVLHYVGRTIVPGEVDLPRHELVISGHEVVEAYTVRKHNERPFITKPGARVLAQAANHDPDIEDAYINRATA